jgi:hypothetical protein
VLGFDQPIFEDNIGHNIGAVKVQAQHTTVLTTIKWLKGMKSFGGTHTTTFSKIHKHISVKEYSA